MRRQGLRLVTRNYRCRYGEIDLILLERSQLRQRVLVFVEVRYRRANRFGGAAASVTPAKQQRLIKTAEHFRMTHADMAQLPARFDVVAVQGSTDNPQLTWLSGAFEC